MCLRAVYIVMLSFLSSVIFPSVHDGIQWLAIMWDIFSALYKVILTKHK